MKLLTLLMTAAFLCIGSSCKNLSIDSKALQTSTGVSPVPEAINIANSNAQAAFKAAEVRYVALSNQSSVAAAQVVSVIISNTNQASSKASELVGKEAALALGNLPAPDLKELLEAEKRRVAFFSGQAEESKRLYKIAEKQTETYKSENAILKQNSELVSKKAQDSQLRLIEADKKWSEQLKANEISNQKKIDEALKTASEEEAKAKEGRNQLIFRALISLGLLCIAGSISLAVLTNGAMMVKSIILLISGICCIGVAQVVAHPWFNTAFTSLTISLIIFSVIYLAHERKDSVAKEALSRTVAAVESYGVAKSDDQKSPTLKTYLSKELDENHKKLIKKIKIDNYLKDKTL